MPEHETFDLDAAFARLEQDVTALSSAPGAGAAVARARRRRRTTIGSVAAVTVLAVGGATIALGVGRHDSATISPTSLPSPAPLTAQTLSTATAGWVAGWSAQDVADAQIKAGPVERCLAQSTSAHATADVTRASGNQVFSSGDTSAVAALVGLARTAEVDAIWDDLTSTFDACRGSTPARQLTWDGASTRSYDVSATGADEHFWVAREGSTVAWMWVTAAPSAVTPAADDGVARALVAALEFPGSMRPVPDSSTSRVSAISQVPFDRALGDWKSGWSASSGHVPDADAAPCGVDLSGGAPSGTSESLGANGQDGTYVFDSADVARRAVQSVGDALAACTTTSYDVHSVPLQGGSVAVAAATGAGSEVVWLVQEGRQVGYVAIPAGDTTPPDSVSTAVGDLLLAYLKASESSADSSASSGQVHQDATPPATKVTKGR